jgi:P-type Mg2+ transporter
MATERTLLLTSIAGAAMTLAVPYSPVAGVLGVAAVPLSMVAALAGVTIGYIGVNELVKARTGLGA